MVVISILVVGLVIFAQNLNSEISEYQAETTKVYNETTQSLVKINLILNILEKEIYEQSINFDKDRIESVNHTYEILIGGITQLINSPARQRFIEHNKIGDNFNYIEIKRISMNMLTAARALNDYILEFNLVTKNYMLRYPAMSLFSKKVLPINQEIQLILYESLMSFDDDGIKLKDTTAIKELYYRARYIWSKQVSSVRLFILNRFGVFGRSLNRNQYLQNRELYLAEFKSILKKLKAHQKNNELSVLQSESLEEILVLLQKYNDSFNQARDIHLSREWRQDLLLLENKVQPQLDLIWEQIVEMQNLVVILQNEGVTLSQSAAKTTSTIIWTAALIILLTLLVIYIVFEKGIREPIYVVAKALNDEAAGQSNVNITGHFSTEINYLLNAFSNMRKQVHMRQFRLQSILDNALEGIIITNEQGVIESFNNSAQSLFCYSEKDIVEENISSLLLLYTEPKRRSSINEYIGKKIDVIGVKKNGEQFHVSIKTNESKTDGERKLIITVEDVSERKELIDNLKFQASHDSLTGLFNRRYFTKELSNIFDKHIRGTQNQYAVLYIDLDNFKYVNDTLGHLAGDKLIIELSKLLLSRVRKTDVLARLGGDEFAILLFHNDNMNLDYIAESFRKLINDYIFKYEGSVIDVSASIGGALLNEGIDTKEKLLACADFACHESKRLGRNQYYIYTNKDDQQLSDMSRDIGWTQRIKDALKNDKFILACQPIFNTKKDSVSYYEILIRMVDVNNEIIMPFAFLTAAERFGLIVDVDAWVLRHSLKLLAKQQKLFNPELKFSINLSANSIDHIATYDLIKHEIEKNNINPKTILFEVTETTAIANLSVAKKLLSKIQALGCKTALDDFGVGYSSFSYLADLPVDIVKIDGSFVKDMEAKHLNKIMVQAINDISHELGKTTVAEFVENEAIYKMLKEMNVDYSQGYHLGNPLIVYDDSKSIELEHRGSVDDDI